MAKYFKPSIDLAIDWARVDSEALARLDAARELAGVPFHITSNYRTPEHSEEVGGSRQDAHTEEPCTAFDIACADSATRLRILRAVLTQFTRVGIKGNHVHVDCSTRLPQNVCWLE